MDISINVYLMLVVFLTFLVLVWLSNAWIYKPMLANMDARQGAIGQDGEFIEKTSQEIARLKQEADHQRKEAHIQANKILQESLQKARQDYEHVLAQKESDLQKDLEVFMQGLKESKSALKLQLSQDLPALELSLQQKISQM
ncbi:MULTISPECIES: F0F1 ATP synthase subunit B family protein [Helicobacter]|uniref:F0F1 ATP synthase subunit B family protein n=1 Tax=Helicobacter TaxID=209 RepID=UPI000EAC787E|nr:MULTISPECIES: F0F1 ATP synthase subunit B' [Helicobacter]